MVKAVIEFSRLGRVEAEKLSILFKHVGALKEIFH